MTQMNISMKHNQTLRHKEQICVCQQVGGGKDWELWINRCKLVYIGWINMVLLYSTEIYIQYPVINHNGKNMKKNMYIIIKLLCCTKN